MQRLCEEDLPIELTRRELDDLIKQVDVLFPPTKYPDFLIEYKPVSTRRVQVLGFGTEDDIIRQTLKLVSNHPELRTDDWEVELVRAETEVLLY